MFANLFVFCDWHRTELSMWVSIQSGFSHNCIPKHFHTGSWFGECSVYYPLNTCVGETHGHKGSWHLPGLYFMCSPSILPSKIIASFSLKVTYCDLTFFLSFFAAVQSLHTLNDQISHFIVTKSKALEEDQDPFLPTEKETLKSSMILMRHLLMDAQVQRSINPI